MSYAMRTDAAPNACSMAMARDLRRGTVEADHGDLVINVPIRIFTLGRFSLAIDQQPVRSAGKAKHRPLGLLKALIALGGRDVAATRLCECLWPDAEGDLGAGNLSITLHRLRSLLQKKAAVLSDNGNLSLNERLCWVDAWRFERTLNEGLQRLDKPSTRADAEQSLRSALRLYAGDFLVREAEESWMLAARLRLRSKFERLVVALSAHFEDQSRFGDAIDLCLQALERDPLNELLYRRLMSCYLKQGEIAKVLGIYLRCCEALRKGLGAAVSTETQRLHAQALQASRQSVTLPGNAPAGSMLVRQQLLS